MAKTRQTKQQLADELKRVKCRVAELEEAAERSEKTRDVLPGSNADTLSETVGTLKGILSSMTELVFAFDRDGRFIFYHVPPGTHLHLPPDQFIGLKHTDVMPAHVNERFLEAFERTRRGETAGYEYRLGTGAGSSWFSAKMSPVLRGEEFTGSVAVIRDITEQRRAEEELTRYSESLEQMVESRTARILDLERQRAGTERLAAAGRMAARVAHEINNPLAGIKNSFRLVKDGVPRDYEYHDYVGLIEREIDRIARIVQDLFDVCRGEQQVVQGVSVSGTISDVLALLDGSLRASGIKKEVDVPDSPMTAILPVGHLEQVLYNIVQNSVDASAQGDVIRVTASMDQGKVTIKITDQGTGIPEEIQDRVFQPFFSSKDTGEGAALGIGLSVSKTLVEAMGGSITSESNEPKGTVFTVTLPAENAPST